MRSWLGAVLALDVILMGCTAGGPGGTSLTLQSLSGRSVLDSAASGAALTAGSRATGSVFDGYVGSVTALGPLATFVQPGVIAYTPDGALYIADGTCIRRAAPDNAGRMTITTVAGDWVQTGTSDGPVHQARFGQITAMMGMPDGTLLLADGPCVRRIAFNGHGDGTVATLAGSATTGHVDGVGIAASFKGISALAALPDGSVLASDGTYIRKLTFDVTAGTTTVSTVRLGGTYTIVHRQPALPGQSGQQLRTVVTSTTTEPMASAPAAVAENFGPIGLLALDAKGTLWLGENHTLKRYEQGSDSSWTSDLTVSGAESSDRVGESAGAAFTSIVGLATLPNGDVLVVDSAGQPLVRRISVDAAGQPHASVLARPLPGPNYPTRYGSWLDSGLSSPQSIAVGPKGEIRVVDQTAIREVDVDADGNATPTTFAGYPLQVPRQDGPAAATALHMQALTPDGQGGYYMACDNALYAATLTPMGGLVTRFLAGDVQLGKVDGAGAAARFDTPNGLLRLPDGSLLVNDFQNDLLRRLTFDASGQATVSTFAGGSRVSYDSVDPLAGDGPALTATIAPNHALCQGPDGTIYFGDRYRVRKLVRNPGGQWQVVSLAGLPKIGIQCVDGPGAQARFGSVGGMALDRNGSLWVVDTDNSLIRRLTFDAAGKATVTSIAGQFVVPSCSSFASPNPGLTGVLSCADYNTAFGFRDGPASQALFKSPTDIVLADDGSFIIVDTGNSALRRLARDASGTWQVTTLVGPGQGMRDGPFTEARLDYPQEIDADGPGRFLVLDGSFPTGQLRTLRMGPTVAESAACATGATAPCIPRPSGGGS